MTEAFTHQLVAIAAAGLGAALFAYAGVRLFRRGWAGYEQRYVSGAERTLDAMWLTLPRQHLVYLALLCMALVMLVAFAIFGRVWAAVPLGLGGLVLPTVVLTILKRARDRRFLTQLVDALSNISNSLKAGQTLPQALEGLAREMPNPMRQEMRLVCQELRLGVQVEEALGHLYERMPSAELDLIVTAVAITRDVGGNLTVVFDNIAQTIRERFRIEGKIHALTAMGRAQAVVVCALPFAIVAGLHFVQPGWINVLFRTAGGVLLLMVCIGLMTVGILLVRRIVAIDI